MGLPSYKFWVVRSPLVISSLYLKNLLTSSLNLSFILFLISTYSSSGTLMFFDTPLRLNSNDFFWVNYYFFWTTFTYLPAFFSATILFLFGVKYFRGWGFYVLVSALLLILYLYEIVDLLSGITNTSLVGTYFWQVNTFLLNSLNKYHPFLLYWGIIASTSPMFYKLFSTSLGSTWMLHQVGSFTKARITKNIYIILIALLLGSWWAFQEGTWGGWWNWDPSEVFGLLFLTLQLINLHENTNYFKLVKVYKKILINLSLLLGIYFFIQLNFEIISHNFGVKFFFFFNNNLFFLTSLSTLIVLVIWYFLQDKSYVKLLTLLATSVAPNTSEKGIVFSAGLWLSTILLITPLAVSFVPTIQYFSYTYFGLNCFNFEIYFGPIVIILVLVWLVIFTQITSLQPLSVTSAMSFFDTSYATLVLSLRSNSRSVAQLHLLLAVFLVATLLLPTYATSYPLFFGSTSGLVIAETSFNLAPQTYSPNIDLVEITTVFRSYPTQSILSTWQLIYDSNNVKLNAYLLPISNLSLSNYYVLQFPSPLLTYLTETGTTQILIIPTIVITLVPYLHLYTLSPKG